MTNLEKVNSLIQDLKTSHASYPAEYAHLFKSNIERLERTRQLMSPTIAKQEYREVCK